MADTLIDPPLPPTPAAVAAGLDLTSTPTTDEMAQSPAITAAAQMNEIAGINTANKEAAVPLWNYAKDMAAETLTGTLIDNTAGRLMDRDPAFGHDRFKARLKAVEGTLPDEYMGDLSDAVSDAHFDFLYGRAKEHVKAQQELASMGWGGWSANLLTQFLDPTSLAAGIGTGSLAVKAVQAARLARGTQLLGNAASGVVGGVAVEALRDSEGLPTPIENYLLAAGLGMTLGAVWGPLGQNPAVSREAAALHGIGETLKAEGEKQLLLPPPMKQLTYAGAKRASEDAAETIHVAPEDGQAPPRAPEVIHVAPAPAEKNAAQTVMERVEQARVEHNLDFDVPPPGSPLRDTLDATLEALNPEPAAPAAGPSKPSAGLIHDAPKEALQKIDGLVREVRLSRDRQRIRDQRIAFEEFRARQQKASDGIVSKALRDLTEFDPPEYERRPNARDIKGEGLSLAMQKTTEFGSKEGRHYFIKLPGDPEPIGYVTLKRQSNGWEVEAVEIDKANQGQGVAKRAYASIEAHIGEQLRPSGFLTPDGYKMWLNRAPEMVANHRLSPNGKLYLSPKQMIAERDGHRAVQNPARQRLADIAETRLAELPPEALSEAKLAAMFARPEGAPARALREVTEDELMAALEEARPTLPGAIRMEAVDALADHGGDAVGVFSPREWLIQVSRRMTTDPRNIVNHEVLHGLRHLNLFTYAEWDLLRTTAAKEGWFPEQIRESYSADYAKQWKELGVDVESPEGVKFLEWDTARRLEEEAIAYRYGEWAAGRKPVTDPTTLTVFQRIKDYLAAVGEKLRRMTGHDTAEDVFKDIAKGKMAQRFKFDGVETSAPEPDSFALGAQRNRAVTHDHLQDPAWVSLTDDNVPQAGGFWRFSRGGRIGKAENAPARLIGSHLLNDSVGKADHSLNPFSADQDYRKLMNQWVGEYDKTRRPAFQEWADDLQLSPAERWTREHEFFEQTGHYIRDTNRRPGAYHPAVERFGNKVATLQKEILEHLKNPMSESGLVGRPVNGAEWVPEDIHYLWRKFDPDKVNGTISEEAFGQSGTLTMLRGAIRSAQPQIPDALLDRLATGYLGNVRARAAGLGDEWSLALGQGDFQRFRAILMDEAGARLTPQEADDIIARLNGGGRQTEGDMSTLKRRVLIDETYIERGLQFGQNGETRDLPFTDLIQTNVNNLFENYARKSAGRVALGRVRVRHPDGTMLIDGITSDAEINNILELTKRWGADNNLIEETKESVEQLRFAFDRILGVPDAAQQGNFAEWSRLLRKYMSTRLMGQVGIAQLGESGGVVGSLGVRAAFSHMPSFRRVIDAAGDLRAGSALREEIEAMGIGTERLHGLHFHNNDEVGQAAFGVGERGFMQRSTNIASIGERATYEASAMSFIQQQQEIWVATSMAQKMANMGAALRAGKALGRGDLRRLAQINIDEPMLQRIFAQMRQHGDIAADGPLFGGKVNRLGAAKWTDLEAKVALENGIFRTTRKLIQAGDEGSAANWMNVPVWQTLFQFRGFGFTAWENQLQYNIHMGDPAALATAVWSIAWNAAVRGAQIKMLAAARSDGAKYEEQNLTPWELGKAGFQRAGWSSIMPMGIDTALTTLGQPGMFNARSSGQSSSLILGNPSASFMDNVSKGLGGTINSLASGRTPSQAEVRTMTGLLPFSNLAPISVGLNYLIQDLPARSPKERGAKPY